MAHREHSLLHAGAVDVVVLNYHVLLEYFHSIQLVRPLSLRQRHLPPTDRTRQSLSNESPSKRLISCILDDLVVACSLSDWYRLVLEMSTERLTLYSGKVIIVQHRIT